MNPKQPQPLQENYEHLPENRLVQELQRQLRDQNEQLELKEQQLQRVNQQLREYQSQLEEKNQELELSNIKIAEYATQLLERNQSLTIPGQDGLESEVRREAPRESGGDLLRPHPGVLYEEAILLEIQQQLAEKEQRVRTSSLQLQEKEEQIAAREQGLKAKELELQEMQARAGVPIESASQSSGRTPTWLKRLFG